MASPDTAKPPHSKDFLFLSFFIAFAAPFIALIAVGAQRIGLFPIKEKTN